MRDSRSNELFHSSEGVFVELGYVVFTFKGKKLWRHQLVLPPLVNSESVAMRNEMRNGRSQVHLPEEDQPTQTLLLFPFPVLRMACPEQPCWRRSISK